MEVLSYHKNVPQTIPDLINTMTDLIKYLQEWDLYVVVAYNEYSRSVTISIRSLSYKELHQNNLTMNIGYATSSTLHSHIVRHAEHLVYRLYSAD